jgi:hypothetical protein
VVLSGKRYGLHIVSPYGLSICDIAVAVYRVFHIEALSAAIKTNSRFNTEKALTSIVYQERVTFFREQ